MVNEGWSATEANSILATAYYANSLMVMCCNGGLPYVDLHYWPTDGSRFHVLDPTDWVATETDFTLDFDSNISSIDNNANPNANVVSLDRHCQLYNLTFTDNYFKKLFERRRGTLSCRCSDDFAGDACDLQTAKLARDISGDRSNSFQAFMFLALIPLSFAVFAAVGGLLIRVCCVDCFGCQWPPCLDGKCTRRRQQRNDEGEGDRLDPTVIDRLLDRSRARDAAKRNQDIPAGALRQSNEEGLRQPATANYHSQVVAATYGPMAPPFAHNAPCLIDSSNLQPQLQQHHQQLPPYYRGFITRGSPPPSYKSDKSSRAPSICSANMTGDFATQHHSQS